MPKRPKRTSGTDAPVTLLVLPGLSLMETRSLGVGMALVRCPACGATKVFTARPGGSPVEFVHERDDCPIRVRIEAALVKLRRAQAAETN